MCAWCSQYYGFVLYRHMFADNYTTGPLSVPGIRDRGYVLINQVPFLYLSCVSLVSNCVRAVSNWVMAVFNWVRAVSYWVMAVSN